MADIGRTSARLRKTFRYPADVDASDDEPEAMDEEGMPASTNHPSTTQASLTEPFVY